MGFFSWMFGGDKAQGWSTSENGNAMMETRGWRLTVYPRDRGWKFALADLTEEEDVYYSDRFRTEDEAKAEGLKMLFGNR